MPSGSVLPGGQARPAPVPMTSTDAARNPSWGQVLATTIRLWLSRRMPRVSIEWPDMSSGPAAAGHAVPVPVLRTPADPSWGQVLVTTISLWLSRRMPRISIEWQHPGRPGGNRVNQRSRLLRRISRGGLPRSARGPAQRGSFGRLLAASVLGLGLLAVGAGTAGMVVASSSAGPAVRLPARPTPVPAPAGRTVAPVWLTTVQRTAPPVLLTIPAIGVRTKLVDLGLNRNGTLQVPASTAVAGWYSGSPPPGAVGAAVIAGHVDSRAGLGIFFWLRTLRPGDRVYVGRSDGTTVVFTVTSVQMYAKDQFPTAAVYGPVPDAELRLITCGGTFDRSLGSYLSNVVVFARLTG
jgi:Sortase domain